MPPHLELGELSCRALGGMGSSPQLRSPEKQDWVLKDKPLLLSQVATDLLPSCAL